MYYGQVLKILSDPRLSDVKRIFNNQKIKTRSRIRKSNITNQEKNLPGSLGVVTQEDSTTHKLRRTIWQGVVVMSGLLKTKSD